VVEEAGVPGENHRSWARNWDYKKECIRLATASDKVYQLLTHGQWFSLGTPASSTTKTGRHDIGEIYAAVVDYLGYFFR
jgi:hypothetical protein